VSTGLSILNESDCDSPLAVWRCSGWQKQFRSLQRFLFARFSGTVFQKSNPGFAVVPIPRGSPSHALHFSLCFDFYPDPLGSMTSLLFAIVAIGSIVLARLVLADSPNSFFLCFCVPAGFSVVYLQSARGSDRSNHWLSSRIAGFLTIRRSRLFIRGGSPWNAWVNCAHAVLWL
jgi:hypothetical protein